MQEMSDYEKVATEEPTDEELDNEESSPNCNLKPVVIGCVVYSFIVIIFTLAITAMVLWFTQQYSGGPLPPPAQLCPFEPPLPQNELISNTRKYLLDIPVNNSTQRFPLIETWIATVNSVSQNFNISMDDLVILPLRQFKLNASNCNAKGHFHKRLYSNGTISQSVYVINTDEDKEHAQSYPYWPASSFVDVSLQMMETNIRLCSDGEYTRETQVFFAQQQEVLYCAHLVVLFPWLFTLSNDDLMNEVLIDDTDHWWLGSFQGNINGNSRYEMEFWFKYDSKSGMMHESEPPEVGVWAFRLFALNDGHSEDWDPQIDADAQNVWSSLQNLYGNTPNCTITYDK